MVDMRPLVLSDSEQIGRYKNLVVEFGFAAGILHARDGIANVGTIAHCALTIDKQECGLFLPLINSLTDWKLGTRSRRQF
jgi:hypothetical protein